MAGLLTVKLNTSSCTAAIALLQKKAAPAVARAMNKSAMSGQVAIARLVAKDMGLAVSNVKPFITIEKARYERLIVTIRASAKRVPLLDFKATGPQPSRGKGPGVRAKLPTGAGRYPHAFITTVYGRSASGARVGGGHKGVFERRPGVGRNPIYELFGPSIWQAYQKHQAEGVARIEEQMAKNLPHEIQFALAKQAQAQG